MIRVLIIDDSALVRKLLDEILSQDPEIEVVGSARDPLDAREKIKRLNPDVLTLDVEMPKMDGITFLSNLMRLRPMPVVMVSSLTQRGAEPALQALELGAIDYVSKPELGVREGLGSLGEEILAKVKTAARARVRPTTKRIVRPAAAAADGSGQFLKTTDRVIAIGASTGGTEAIREVLSVLPRDMPGIVVTQHIPEAFSKAFTRRLDSHCAIRVVEPKDGDAIMRGHAYVAPGNQHLSVRRSGARYFCCLSDSEPVNLHRPSVDVLFQSVAQHVGPNAIGVLLTGMGADGARGLKEMRDNGAFTVAQDKESCVVFGMPGKAIELGAAVEVVHLDDVGKVLIKQSGASAAA
ncbi:MAG: chemotaxis response regulator protein-glutamate methylesterase [Myxococcota bacterium]